MGQDPNDVAPPHDASATDDGAVVGTIEHAAPAANDPLPTTEVVKTETVVPISIDERVKRLEDVLRGYITNPPKLADAEIITNKLTELFGLFSSVAAQCQTMSDTLPDRVSRAEERVAQVVRDVAAVASTNGVPLTPAPHVPEHQTSMMARTFVCGKCGTGFNDVVPGFQVTNSQRPCPTCGHGVAADVVTLVAPE